MTMWAEPKGASQQVVTDWARFVVVRTHSGFSVCLRSSTYSGQATTKPGVNARDHAAVVPVGTQSTLLSGERLEKKDIQVKIENDKTTIDPMSRINFAKPYTVEHNVEILNIGRVVGESVGLLDKYFAESLGHTKP